MARAPVTVRLPDTLEDGLREAAERGGRTLSAEIVARLTASLAETGEPETAALKTATLAVLEASHGGLGDVLPGDYVRRQFKAAMDAMLDALGTGEGDNEVGRAAAQKVLNEMRGGGDTSLGVAGRELGLTKEAKE